MDGSALRSRRRGWDKLVRVIEPRLPRLLALTVVATAALLGVAAPAQAHDSLVSSTPASGAVLTTIPETFEVTMNQAVLDVGDSTAAFALQVIDSAGLYYGDGCVAIDGGTMSTAAELGAPGAYTVRWQNISSDGHTISGEYPFTFSPTSPPAASSGSATAPVCGATTPGEATPTPPTAEESPSPRPDTNASGDSAQVTPSDQGENDDSSLAFIIGGGVLAAATAGAIIYILLTRAKK